MEFSGETTLFSRQPLPLLLISPRKGHSELNHLLSMHFSGLLVLSKTDSVKDCVRELTQCPGVDVFLADETSGRIIAVLETETVKEQEVGLRHAQGLPSVISAELVYHYFGDACEVSFRPYLDEKS
jgi:nitrate reductase NapAB chaperone NapD